MKKKKRSNTKEKVVSGKIPWYRIFEVYEESISSYYSEDKDWQCTSRIGLISAFLKGKPIRKNFKGN
jgi:hypothetical protein